MTADEIVNLLGLEPHPEGGFFRETFRDTSGAGGRSASTAIYYLLDAGQRSHWHRVDAVETWHFYAGSPLRLFISGPEGRVETVLGSDFAAGQRPQAIVPKDWWQAAETLGGWALVGCTVAPGFEFAGFEMAPKAFEP